MTSYALGLLGSGEFEPWSGEADRWLMSRATGDGQVLVLPTASAPEGDRVFDDWAAKGLAHYDALGIAASAVPLKTRDDAERTDLAAPLERASLVFFSGGNPAYLARTLAGTLFWDAVLREMRRGMAYAGCSAGAACLGPAAPDTTVDRFSSDVWKPGLNLFRDVYVGPHWDALDAFAPGLSSFVIRSIPPGHRLLAIDEHTAVVGDGSRWSVMGAAQAHMFDDGQRRDFGAGESFEEALT